MAILLFWFGFKTSFFFLKKTWYLLLFRLLGSHSAMEHHTSIYFCNERKMSAGCDRICGPHRMWRGIFVRPGPQQAHGKQGINTITLPFKKYTSELASFVSQSWSCNILKRILRRFINVRSSLYTCFIGFSCEDWLNKAQTVKTK